MIDFEQEDGIGIVKMNNNAAKNSFDVEFAELFIDRVEQANEKCDAIVIAGVENIFSAGYNVKIIGKDQEATKKLVELGAKIVVQLLDIRKPVIAACTGHAIALGAVILLGCDIRIGASGKFKIGLNETQLGLGLPVFATELAKQRIPHQHVHKVILEAELHSPEKALIYGFLDQVVNPDEVMPESIARAKLLAKYSARTYGFHKRQLNLEYADTVRASLNEPQNL